MSVPITTPASRSSHMPIAGLRVLAVMCAVAIVALSLAPVGCTGDIAPPPRFSIFIDDGTGTGTGLTSFPDGTIITIDGVEISVSEVELLADDPTAGSGSSPLTLFGELVTISMPGFDPIVLEGVSTDDELYALAAVTDYAAGITITKPAHAGVIVAGPQHVANPQDWRLCIDGIATREASDTLMYDVAFVLDTSGSTGDEIGDFDGDSDPDTVLEAEVEAVRRVLNSIENPHVHASLVTFADLASTQVQLTNDFNQIHTILDAMSANPSLYADGGTNFEQAVLAAVTELTGPRARSFTFEEAGTTLTVPSYRLIVFVSDGIPTTWGNPYDPQNFTQQAVDRNKALGAAGLAEAANITLNAVAVDTNDDLSKLKTLPAMCAITDGRYYLIDDILNLPATAPALTFSGAVSVEAFNETYNATNPPVFVTVTPSISGEFHVDVPWVMGANTITIRVTIDVNGVPVFADKTITVDIIDAGEIETHAEIVASLFSTLILEPVTVANLLTPLGTPLGNNLLQSLFLDPPTRVFDDLLEANGFESFKVTGAPGQNPGDPYNATFEVIAEHAGYRTDWGIAEYDPVNPPANVLQLLSGNTFVLFNSGDFGGSGLQVFPMTGPGSGVVHATVQLTVGKAYVPFIVPNGELVDYLNDPSSTKEPLTTIPSLNPGGYAQILTYISEQGRIDPPGTGGTHDGQFSLVFNCEDITLAGTSSDMDYMDLMVRLLVPLTEVIPGFSENAFCPYP